MKLTYLGGRDKADFSSPGCFVLDLCHTRVLLECPIDLSALLWFLPSVLPSNEQESASLASNPKSNASVLFHPSSSSRSSLAGKSSSSATSSRRNSVDHQEVLWPAQKRPRVGIERNKAAEGDHEKKIPRYLKEIDGQYFIDAAPWYKTPDFSLIDITSLNAVIISNPVAMLGLPLLTRNPDFTAKIYVTEATAKLGQLMMEELVSLQTEFTQLYRRSVKSAIPPWPLPSYSTELPSQIREQKIGTNAVGEQWHSLYSTVDVRACIARLHRLHYGEEANIDGCLKVQPSSSGFGIGASNWVLKGSNRSLSYVSTSTSTTNHAMPLDISALEGSQVLLFSDGDAMKSLQDDSCDAGRKEEVSVASENRPVDAKVVDLNANDSHLASEGGAAPVQSVQRMSSSPASSVSPGPQGPTGGASGISQKLPSHTLLSATPEKSGKSATEENEGTGLPSAIIIDERIKAICKVSSEVLGDGGSVLIPINLYGMVLELMEEMSSHLRSVGLEQTPIYYISPVAEELLAYANTVPEWLCPARQEKLYAGESLFGFVEAIQEKRLRHFQSLHSSDLMDLAEPIQQVVILKPVEDRSWQEPCVVFATHWSLRVGSAVHLLKRWGNNPLCLLVLTEPNVDQRLLLAPFKALTIQVLHLPIVKNLSSHDVVSIIQKLKPQLTLVPENLKDLGKCQEASEVGLGLLWPSNIWTTLKIPRFRDDLEVELSADLALQIQLKQVKTGKVAAARVRAELHVKDGHWSLDMANPSTYSRSNSLRSLPQNQIRWGKVDVESLMTALRERGMYDIFVSDGNGQENEESNCRVIEIKSPSQAKIELTSSSINVHANEASLRRLIVELVNNSLSVL